MKDIELDVLRNLLALPLSYFEDEMLEKGVAFARKKSKGGEIMIKLTDAKLIPSQLDKYILGNPRLGKYQAMKEGLGVINANHPEVVFSMDGDQPITHGSNAWTFIKMAKTYPYGWVCQDRKGDLL